MADEKILKEETFMAGEGADSEMLTDEELDAVAGGTTKEIDADLYRLCSKGVLKWNKNYSDGNIYKALGSLGKEVGLDISVKVHDNKNTANQYFVNGNQVSRLEMWSIINETQAANK